MNDLSKSNGLSGGGRCSCEPIPAPVICILIALFSIGLGVSIFILVVVHNALLLLIQLLLSTLVFALLLWNTCSWKMKKKKSSLLAFLDTFPDSDLPTANHGQLVKITGSFTTDTKSSIRAMVKAGYDSKVVPLIDESTLVSTTRKNRVLSSYLRKWLAERNLSADARLLRLEEGYIKDGSSVTLMGVLIRSNSVAMIVQPPEPISMGCLWRNFFLPVDFDGLIISLSGEISSMATLSSP